MPDGFSFQEALKPRASEGFSFEDALSEKDDLPWDTAKSGAQLRAEREADKTVEALVPPLKPDETIGVPQLLGRIFARTFLQPAVKGGQSALGERPLPTGTEGLQEAALGATPFRPGIPAEVAGARPRVEPPTPAPPSEGFSLEEAGIIPTAEPTAPREPRPGASLSEAGITPTSETRLPEPAEETQTVAQPQADGMVKQVQVKTGEPPPPTEPPAATAVEAAAPIGPEFRQLFPGLSDEQFEALFMRAAQEVPGGIPISPTATQSWLKRVGAVMQGLATPAAAPQAPKAEPELTPESLAADRERFAQATPSEPAAPSRPEITVPPVEPGAEAAPEAVQPPQQPVQGYGGPWTPVMKDGEPAKNHLGDTIYENPNGARAIMEGGIPWSERLTKDMAPSSPGKRNPRFMVEGEDTPKPAEIKSAKPAEPKSAEPSADLPKPRSSSATSPIAQEPPKPKGRKAGSSALPSVREEAEKPAEPKSEWEYLGTNADGVGVYKNQFGVHSTLKEGIRSIEPVRMRPTKSGGMEMSVPEPKDKDPEYQVATPVTQPESGLEPGQNQATEHAFGFAEPPPRPTGALKNAIYDSEHGVGEARFEEFETSPEYQAYRKDLDNRRSLWGKVDYERNSLKSFTDRLREPDVGPTERARAERIIRRIRPKLEVADVAARQGGVDPEQPFPVDEMFRDWMSGGGPQPIGTASPKSTPKATRKPREATPFTPQPTEPKRLAQFLRQDFTVGRPGDIQTQTIDGGLRDTGGDLKAIVGGDKAKGPLRAILGGGKGSRSLINNETGQNLDDAALRAWEAGYFPEYSERPTINELLDKLDEDINRGNPQYSQHDQPAIDAYRGAMARNHEIDRLATEHDIPTRGLTHDQFFDALHDKLSVDEWASEHAKLEPVFKSAYQEFENAAKDWNPDEFHGSDQSRTLEDLENEYRQEIAALEASERDQGGSRSGDAASSAGAGEESRGHVGNTVGNAGRESPQGGAGQTDLLGKPIAASAGRKAPEPTIKNDPNQVVMPGMGPSAVQAQAARDQSGRGGLMPSATQEKANEGLFAPKEPEQPELLPVHSGKSWVIVDKETGKALFETFEKKTADAVNRKKYRVVPILEYLQSQNKPKE